MPKKPPAQESTQTPARTAMKTTVVPAEYALIQEAIRATGLDEANFLRHAALEYARATLFELEHRKVVLEHAARYGAPLGQTVSAFTSPRPPISPAEKRPGG